MVNESEKPGLLVEVGDRSAGDTAEYPNDDLAIVSEGEGHDAAGPTLNFARKDGTPYK